MILIRSMFIKYLTQPSVGFEPYALSYGAMGFSGLISLLIGIFYYWSYIAEFNMYFFLIGFFASVFDTVGKAVLAQTFTIGPAGPILCFKSLESVILTIFECLRLQKTPNISHIAGLILGLIGSFVLSQNPEAFDKSAKNITACLVR